MSALLSILITVLIAGLIIGVALWAIRLIPMPAPFQQIAYAIIGIIVLLWALSWFTGYGGMHSINFN